MLYGSFSSNPNHHLCFSFTDVPSLCYSFTITPNRQPWCAVQGQVNGNTFLIYTCSSKMAEPIGPLGMKVNATGAWKTQTETLKDLTEELKKALPNIKPEIITTIGKFERLRAEVEQM